MSDNSTDHERHTSLAAVDVPSIGVGEDHHSEEVRALKSKNSGFIGEAKVDLGMGIAVSSPMYGDMGLGAMVMPKGSGLDDTDLHRNQFVDQNQLALLSELGNVVGLGSKETNALTEDKCLPLSDRDEMELFKSDPETLLLQWKNSGTNTSGPFHGEAESDLL